MALIKFSTPPKLAGLFFCLASAEGAGLLFCPVAICLNTSVYRGFYVIHASYTTHTAKQRTGLYSGIPCDCARSIAHDTRPAQLTIIPPATRWSVSQRRSASGTYQIPAPHWTLYRLAQPPYYNNVYKDSGAPLLWVHASPAGSAPAVCGLLASATPGAPAKGSASPPVQGQPGGLQSGTGQ